LNLSDILFLFFLKIRTQAFSLQIIPTCLQTIPTLKRLDCNVLYQGLGSLQNISRASIDDIIQYTPLKLEKATIVHEFFKQDSQF